MTNKYNITVSADSVEISNGTWVWNVNAEEVSTSEWINILKVLNAQTPTTPTTHTTILYTCAKWKLIYHDNKIDLCYSTGSKLSFKISDMKEIIETVITYYSLIEIAQEPTINKKSPAPINCRSLCYKINGKSYTGENIETMRGVPKELLSRLNFMENCGITQAGECERECERFEEFYSSMKDKDVMVHNCEHLFGFSFCEKEGFNVEGVHELVRSIIFIMTGTIKYHYINLKLTKDEYDDMIKRVMDKHGDIIRATLDLHNNVPGCIKFDEGAGINAILSQYGIRFGARNAIRPPSSFDTLWNAIRGKDPNNDRVNKRYKLSIDRQVQNVVEYKQGLVDTMFGYEELFK